jgi:hypothetical protein
MGWNETRANIQALMDKVNSHTSETDEFLADNRELNEALKKLPAPLRLNVLYRK